MIWNNLPELSGLGIKFEPVELGIGIGEGEGVGIAIAGELVVAIVEGAIIVPSVELPVVWHLTLFGQSQIFKSAFQLRPLGHDCESNVPWLHTKNELQVLLFG